MACHCCGLTLLCACRTEDDGAQAWHDRYAASNDDNKRLRAQHATLRSLAEALVASLPKCDNHPDRPATKAVKRGSGRWCDECGDPKTWRGPYAAHDYPRAAPLRALVAELAKGES